MVIPDTTPPMLRGKITFLNTFIRLQPRSCAASIRLLSSLVSALNSGIIINGRKSYTIQSTALKNCSANILHITPYRSFPSGVTASASKRHEYLRWAENGRYIIEDDFESEFSVSKKPEETLFTDTKKDNVIYMNTFSMTISPSLRAGYMVLPKHLVPIFEEKLGFYSCTVPTFEQYVLAELIENGDFERHINRVRRKKRKELKSKEK